MEHRPLGKTGIKIPRIIFGTSALGNLYSSLSYDTKNGIVRECLDNVPNPVVFDTAGKYGAGLALEMLGRILGNLQVSEDDVIISNKLGWLRTPLSGPEPEFERGVWIDIKNDARQSIGYEGILECWAQGNELLGEKYRPSMVSVHDPDEYLAQAGEKTVSKKLFSDIVDAYRALSVLKSEGKVKAVGVGAKNWETIRMISEEVDLDWVMFANSMTIYRHPKELLKLMEKLHRKGVAIINSAVFHAGFLTGGDFFDYVRINRDSPENNSKFLWRWDFFAVCREFNVLPASACVQFALTPPGVISISLNTSRPERVKENVSLVESEIPDEFWKEMKRRGLIDNEYPYL
jgi:D-threo-aldose 1-dehydrogenase